MHSIWRDSARLLSAAFLTIAALATMPQAGLAQVAPVTGARSLSTPRPRVPQPTSPADVRGRAHDASRALGDPGARREPFPIGLDLAVATHAPITVGLEANLEFPLGLLLRGHFGFMPDPYVDAINGIATDFGAYDRNVSAAVNRSGSDAFVMRLSGGIRPAPGYGFEILAGYTLIVANASVSTQDFESATGQSMDYPGLTSIGIGARLHAFHVEIGWSALIVDHLVIRASIGWMHTLAADADVDVPSELRARAAGRIEAIETDIREAMTSYGFSPEARIAVGYRF